MIPVRQRRSANAQSGSALLDSEGRQKHFYQRFHKEHVLFAAHVQGLSSAAERDSYTSFLLYRLLFVFFLQQHGMLDRNTAYLHYHLARTQYDQGPDRFYSSFLLPFFHDGLGSPARSSSLYSLLGHVPFLTSSLFAVHPLEEAYPALTIPDYAFAQLFRFFSAYHWNLHEQEAEGDITPTLVGGLFEEHINHYQLGAYYTKSDVTTYISHNTIIPVLFDAISQRYPSFSAPESTLWQLLSNTPNHYIHADLRSPTSLPGETAKEYELRYSRYQQLYTALSNGTVQTFDELVTCNLDLLRLACDTLGTTTDDTLLLHWYQCLQDIRVLDPTCGSGAFLFAALQTLAQLYSVCLERMAALHLALPPFYYSNKRRYELFTLIVTHNLYGVDIMEEATDMCKLRLFLLLLAQLDTPYDLTPLPILDRQIVTGNVLLEERAAKDTVVYTTAKGSACHWLTAFAPVLERGGFDVILGNPPYVEYSPKKFPYTLHDFETLACSNLYPCVVERSRQLLAASGRIGMILPLAAFATKNMAPFQQAFQRWFPGSWLSFYHFRPSMLFSGSKMANIPTTIFLARPSGAVARYSSHLCKWSSEQRQQLFPTLTYCHVSSPADPLNRHYYPKFGQPVENALLQKILQHQPVSSYRSRLPNDNALFYRSAGGLYWKVFVNFPWPYQTTSNKQGWFKQEFERDVFVAVFNSSLFWWYYTVTFDTFNLKNYMLFGFRFTYPTQQDTIQHLMQLCERLMADFRFHAQHLTRGRTGSYTIYARKSKTIIDEIDQVLAHHYGLTEEELDFILHYDLKYRLGLAACEE